MLQQIKLETGVLIFSSGSSQFLLFGIKKKKSIVSCSVLEDARTKIFIYVYFSVAAETVDLVYGFSFSEKT